MYIFTTSYLYHVRKSKNGLIQQRKLISQPWIGFGDFKFVVVECRIYTACSPQRENSYKVLGVAGVHFLLYCACRLAVPLPSCRGCTDAQLIGLWSLEQHTKKKTSLKLKKIQHWKFTDILHQENHADNIKITFPLHRREVNFFTTKKSGSREL